MIWWEKTVEYLFLATHLTAKGLLIMPLAGTEEQAGDARLKNASCKWSLLEFKRTEEHFDSEFEKFATSKSDDGKDQYNVAKRYLEAEDGLHHLVYGIGPNDANAHQLMLGAQTYFSRTPSLNSLHKGATLEDFSSYVLRFTAFKNGWDGSDDGGEGAADLGLSEKTFSLVAGVNAERGEIICMTLSDFTALMPVKPDPSAGHSTATGAASASRTVLEKRASFSPRAAQGSMPIVPLPTSERKRKLKR